MSRSPPDPRPSVAGDTVYRDRCFRARPGRPGRLKRMSVTACRGPGRQFQHLPLHQRRRPLCGLSLVRRRTSIPGDTNFNFDAYVKDRQTGNVERVSFASNGAPIGALLRRRGSAATAATWCSLLPRASCQVTPMAPHDVYMRDRMALTTTRVSVGNGGVQANGASFYTAINGDGRFVAFAADADQSGRRRYQRRQRRFRARPADRNHRAGQRQQR